MLSTALREKFISDIYTLGSLDEYRLKVLTGLNELISCESSAYFLVDPDNHEFMEPVQHQLEDKCFEEYSSYYHQFDIYKERVFSQNRIPQVDRASDYLNYREWGKNEHRADFLLKYKINHISCIQVLKHDSVIGEISLHRSQKQTDFSNEEMQTLAMLSLHIQKSLYNHLAFRELRTLNQVVVSALQSNDKAILILDSNLNVFFINETAEMFISAKEKLHKQNIMQDIKESCRFLKQTTKRRSIQSWHIVDSRYLNSSVINLKTSIIYDDITQNVYYYCEFPLTIQNQMFAEELALLGQLTHREKTVLKLMLEGKTNRDIANLLVLSINTVKSHTKNILQKCNARTRVELMEKMMLE